MKTKCPNCGAVSSLDSLIANDEAAAAIVAVAALSGELGKLAIRYCGLFRPAKNQLTFARLTTLINEMLPHIQSQRLEFDGKLFDAPIEAWTYAINEMLRQREQGKLKLPLSNHNYLFRIVSAYKPTVAVGMTVDNSASRPTAPASQLEAGAMALQQLKR